MHGERGVVDALLLPQQKCIDDHATSRDCQVDVHPVIELYSHSLKFTLVTLVDTRTKFASRFVIIIAVGLRINFVFSE